jgi:hypothetical protein
MTLTPVPTYTLPKFLSHANPTAQALLVTDYLRNEIGAQAMTCIATPLLPSCTPEQLGAGMGDIADLLDKAEDYNADPADAIDKHYGQPFSGSADAFADVERDKARADARLTAELLASLGGAR